MWTQGSAEWLEERKKCIGGSEAPIIMGVSPWCSPYKLWQQKLSIIEIEAPSWAMRRGIETEEEARCAYEKKTGNIMFPDVKKHSVYNWMIGSVDGITIEQDLLLEIKCAGVKDHETALQGRIPEKYFPQVQHYLEIYDLPVLHYWSYHNGEGALVEVLRDAEYIKSLLDKELAFMKCLKEQIAPEGKKFVVCQGLEWERAIDKWRTAKKKLDTASREECESREELLKMSEGCEAICGKVEITSYTKKGCIDYGKIPELKGVNLEKYRKKPTEVWRIYDKSTIPSRDGRNGYAIEPL